jgi:hypothetical protein
MYVLTKNNRHFTTLHYGNHPYKVVFKDMGHVMMVQGNHINRINIKRTRLSPLNNEYQQKMLWYGVPDWDVERITMDNDSIVTMDIDRNIPSDMDVVNTKTFSIYEALLLPKYECGVIIPQYVIDQSPTQIIFKSHIIDPPTR